MEKIEAIQKKLKIIEKIPKSPSIIPNPKYKKWIINSDIKIYYKTINDNHGKTQKMRALKKNEVKNLISNKRIDIVKKL